MKSNEDRLIAQKRGWIIGFFLFTLLTAISYFSSDGTFPRVDFGFGNSLLITRVSVYGMLMYWLMVNAYVKLTKYVPILLVLVVSDLIGQIIRIRSGLAPVALIKGHPIISDCVPLLLLDLAMLVIAVIAFVRYSRHH